MEIGLPNKDQRIEIFNIHMAHLKSNNLLSDVDIVELAEITQDRTGAEIESLVQTATMHALLRMTEGGDGNVSTADFLLAMKPLSLEETTNSLLVKTED